MKHNEIADYLLDNYGICDRETDCYWGKDEHGRWNGCHRTGWQGRQCKHWKPIGATSLEELAKINRKGQSYER